MKCALIGSRLTHSYSKIIHDAMGGYSYDLVELDESELKDFVQGGGYDGFNVTIPYKKAIMPYCSYISPSAQKIGSVNTVVRRGGQLSGYNTDYDGFRAISERGGIDFSGKKVAILGTGGTACTAKAVVSDLGAREIVTVSRNGEFNYSNVPLWNDCEIIVNTTPVGMFPSSGECLISPEDFKNCRGVIDVIYNPHKTRLIFEAERLGIPAIGGLYMLVYQAKRAYEIFTGNDFPDEKAEEIFLCLERDTQNIVLIGMPGSGKSTLGKKIAAQLNREFIDTDAEIEKAANMTIPEIFERYGEAHFREIEAEIAMKCGSLSGKVIATGGGIVLRPENHYALAQNGVIYHVKRNLDRLATRNRPLSKSPERLREMEKERAPLYEKFADYVIDNSGNLSDFKFEY